MSRISRRNFIKGVAAAGVAAGSFGFPAVLRKAHAAPTVLKFGNYNPPQSFLGAQVFGPWVERVNKAGEGVLKIDLFLGGQLGPDPSQQLKMVTDGLADIGSSGLAFAAGRFPDSTVTNVPFVANTMLEATIAVNRMHEKNPFNGWSDILPLSLNTQPQALLHTLTPIRLPRDLAGVKIRTTGRMQQEMISAAGGTPVAESITRVAENLSRNVFQGTVGEWQGMETFRIVDVARNHTYAPMGTNIFPIFMNRRSFDRMPAAAQDILMQHSGLNFSIIYAKTWDAHNDGIEQRLRADPAHTHIDLSEEAAAIWKATLEAAVQGWTGTNASFPALLDRYKEEVANARRYIAEQGL